MKDLQKRFVILKTDKGQGVVLLKKDTYVEALEKIFSDKRKFKEVKEDTTITRVETIKSYINSMFTRGEITASKKKERLRNHS